MDPAAAAETGAIVGTVTDDDTAGVLDQICVTVENQNTLDTWSDQTDVDGTYLVAGLPDGDYVLRFEDCSGSDTYVSEYYDDTLNQFEATFVTVDGGDATSDVNAALTAGGHITGTVTAADGVTPLHGICVAALDEDFNSITTQTDVNGNDIAGLKSRDYIVQFDDCLGGPYLTEYYDDAATWSAAADVTVTAPDTITDINVLSASVATSPARSPMPTAAPL